MRIHAQARTILYRGRLYSTNEWDPIGIVDPSAAPTDEYDCLLGMIGELRGGMTERQLAMYLKQQLRDHFGLNPKPAHPKAFAKRVYEWYWANPLPE